MVSGTPAAPSGRVLVVGSVNVDLVVQGERLPLPGETVLGGTFSRFHGGKGGNQAVAAARLGVPVMLVAALGWLQGTLLGNVATAVAVMAVAAVGFMMLTGRLNWRFGATVIIGCFVLFGAASIVASSLWSPMPWSDAPSYFGDRDNVYAASARELLDDVPADAVVSANYRLTPHLAYRTEIYQFPVPFRVVLYGPDASLEGSRLAERAERVEFVLLPVSRDAQLEADWAAVGAAFDEVERNDFWVLYRRDRDTPLPPP